MKSFYELIKKDKNVFNDIMILQKLQIKIYNENKMCKKI